MVSLLYSSVIRVQTAEFLSTLKSILEVYIYCIMYIVL